MFIDTTAYRTGLRGMPGVNQFDPDPGQPCFIFDKAPQLAECPGVLLPPLALPNRDSGSNALQILKSNSSSSVFSLRNNTLRDCVIDICSKASFLSGTLLKKPFGLFRTFTLKFSLEFGMTLSKPIYLPAGVSLTIRVRGNIFNSQVNAEKSSGVGYRRLFNLTGLVKIKLPILIDQIGFPSKVLKKLNMLFAGSKVYFQSAIYSPYGYCLIGQAPGKDAFIVGNATLILKKAFSRLVEFISVRNLCQNSHHYLSSKTKSLPQIVIKKVVKVILAKSPGLPGMVADIVSGIIYFLQGREKSFVLRFARKQFNLCNQLHSVIISQFSTLDKKGGVWQFIPSFKKRGFLATFL